MGERSAQCRVLNHLLILRFARGEFPSTYAAAAVRADRLANRQFEQWCGSACKSHTVAPVYHTSTNVGDWAALPMRCVSVSLCSHCEHVRAVKPQSPAGFDNKHVYTMPDRLCEPINQHIYSTRTRTFYLNVWTIDKRERNLKQSVSSVVIINGRPHGMRAAVAC